MRYYFVAGEASGDLHASGLISALRGLDPRACVRGFGGELMEQAGMQLVKHYREMAFMGFIPVLLNLRSIRENLLVCREDLIRFRPDVLILVDYPGFNLRMAQFAKKHGIRVFYYISPKIWAWKTRRIKQIRAWVDEMFTILPFETDFYRKHNYPVRYVGNPVLDAVASVPEKKPFNRFCEELGLPEKSIIALLPGSRLQEIRSLLPRMLEAASAFSAYQLLVTAAPNVPAEVYERLCKGYTVKLVRGMTYEVLQQAEAAVLASGTVSLEAGIIGCPQIVCYRMSGGALFFVLGKWLIKTGRVSLVNLVLQREAVRELLQHHCSVKNIRAELKRVIDDPTCRRKIGQDYAELKQKLGKPGASGRAAEQIVKILKETA